MRFASLLLLGLLATALHAGESKRVMRPVKISYQMPQETESLPIPDVPPDEIAVTEEYETVESYPATTDGSACESAGCAPIVCSASGCTPSGCQSRGCHHSSGCLGGGLHGHHRCSYCSRCDMPQHMPYFAQPSTYYYLRPYNYFHIPLIQEEAVLQGATAQNPYDTDLFEEVYRDYEGNAAQINETQASPFSDD